MPKKTLLILVYGLLIKSLNMAMSCGANIAAASLFFQMIQKLRDIPNITPLVMNAAFHDPFSDTHAYTSQGRIRKIWSSQGGYQPQKQQPSLAITQLGKKLIVMVNTDHQYELQSEYPFSQVNQHGPPPKYGPTCQPKRKTKQYIGASLAYLIKTALKQLFSVSFPSAYIIF